MFKLQKSEERWVGGEGWGGGGGKLHIYLDRTITKFAGSLSSLY